jgi:PadR family transcriptional regulator AphA
MSRTHLTPVSYLILGLVSRGASTPYELKQRVAKSIGYFWSFPHSQFYSEPQRLVGLGLLAEEREASGRRRRTFTITEVGRRALTEWLREPARDSPQVRDTGLLKLFFGDALTRDELVELALAQRAVHRERLAAYQELEQKIADDPQLAFPGATLRVGLLMERAFVDFWQAIADDPPDPA